MHTNAKNIFWFENLVFVPLVCGGFSVGVKYFVLQSLTLPETAVYQKAWTSRKHN